MTELPDFLTEYFDWESRQQEAVEKALAPEQRAITWGDHFIRVFRTPWASDSLIAIFGRIYRRDELARVESDETMESLDRLAPRFLTATCYSIAEPEGEIGSINRWDMWPISHGQFLLAQEAGWVPTGPEVWPWFHLKVYEMATKRGDIPDEPPPGHVDLGPVGPW